MKRLVGFALLGAIGYFLWRNHFKALFQPKDPTAEKLEEVRALNSIGDNKRAVQLANQVPMSSVGDTPYAGIPLIASMAAILTNPKDLQLLPKSGTTSPNPYDRTLSSYPWNN